MADAIPMDDQGAIDQIAKRGWMQPQAPPIPLPAARPVPAMKIGNSEIQPPAATAPIVGPPADSQNSPDQAAVNAYNAHPISTTAPIRSGVASLWAREANIHNPILRTAAKVGTGILGGLETVGDIVAPRVTANIPGTRLNKEIEAGREQRAGAQQAGTEHTQAETEHAQAETEAIQNPAEKPATNDFELWARQNPTAPAGDWLKLQEGVKADNKATPRAEQPITADEANQVNAERAQQWHVLHPNAELPTSYMSKAGETRDVVKEADERFGKLSGAEGTAATREATKQQREQSNQQHADSVADRNNKADTALKEKAITYWQPALDSAERVNVMSKNYREGVDNHNQQAMLSLLSNHLGMTMGLQKGARLNQAIIAEAQKSAPWLQSIGAKFDKDGYLSGVTLTPEQMKQMLDLGFERYREDVKKARSMTNYIGVTDEPPRHISKDSARYYVEGAGGDAGKARQMAKEDGWNF